MSDDVQGGPVTTIDGPDDGRLLPGFFVEWRSGWGESASSWGPTDYLNQEAAVPAVVAAGWLFNPSTVGYRGGIFLRDRFDAATVDRWFSQFPDDPGRIEAVVNTVTLYDLFVNVDLDPYEDGLPGLARDIAACWAGVLARRYPDRNVQVRTEDAYGPSVTFWTATEVPAAGEA
ncbi:hypothetical protein [Plantactinospora sonchi]|uniref:Barstar (barnase inhibitor) domain-containing protein n=1 Tax=Plantactinospora sonchi TaxID=1544735 RepID=A0ABU7RNY6_9ACTN